MMKNFKEFPVNSQSGCEVMYFDGSAAPTDLYECATRRLDAVQKMLEELSEHRASVPTDAMPAVADVCAILMSDANGMLRTIHKHLLEYQLGKLEGLGVMPKPSSKNR